MTVHVLVSGVLYRNPEQRTSKAGRPFVTATIRAKDGDGSQWWKAVAFCEDARAAFLRLGDGEAVCAQGALQVETYERDGATRVSLGVVVDVVCALRQPSKSRAPRVKQQQHRDPRRPREAGGDLLDSHRGDGGVDPRFNDFNPVLRR